ncbi:MAG TPA: twin-arginine translocase TatA/TatE family subunit [Bacteroidota bacterium]
MGNLGVPELLVILLIVLVFFGSKKIPELAQGLGKGIREFRKASRDLERDDADDSPKLEEPKRIEPRAPEQR